MIDKPEISVRLIRLADGTLIDPSTRQPVVAQATSVADDIDEIGDDGAETLPDVSTIVPLARRSLHDLTLPPQHMAAINNVLVYTLWGLPDDEIAIQCGCDVVDIHTVRDLTEYRTMHDALIAGVRASYSASAHGVIAKHAVRAAHVVANTLGSSSKLLALSAAKDILDRSGHRPVDHASVNININKGNEDQLVIRVVREQDRPHIPTLDLRANGS